MRLKDNITNEIVDAIQELSGKKEGSITIMPYDSQLSKKNELLFFLKPEVTELEKKNINAIMKMIFDKFHEFGIIITGVRALNGRYLDIFNIMSRHYGVINEIARKGVKVLNGIAASQFKEVFGREVDQVKIFGAFELLSYYPDLDAIKLNEIWDSENNYKLASGTYCVKTDKLNSMIYILNGFHPFQLLHFTRPSATIIAFVIQSDNSWRKLRDKMTGATNPKVAYEDSLRYIFAENADALGIKEVSQSYNCIHLSAGPLEALLEITRFISDYKNERILGIENTATGNYYLTNGLEYGLIDNLLENRKIHFNQELVSPFELTELMDLDRSVEFINTYKSHLINH